VDEILAGAEFGTDADAESAGVAAVLRLALARLGPAQHSGTANAAERR